MGRLNIFQRFRVIDIYNNENFRFCKNKFERLKILAANEGIEASSFSLRRLIRKWQQTSWIFCFI